MSRLPPEVDYILLGPVADLASPDQLDRLAYALGGQALVIGRDHVAARLPVSQLDGVNRWRWMAAALTAPALIGTPHWRVAAARWRPSISGATVRLLTPRRWAVIETVWGQSPG